MNEEEKVLVVKENVLAKNEEEAEIVREELKKHDVYFVNVRSSPGSGKTTLLSKLIPCLEKKGLSIGVLEADIDGKEDRDTIKETTKAKVIQVHTSGACHRTAQRTKESIEALGLDDVDVVFLENIGNLVCPAEFDTGANQNRVLLSVPEGVDKPLKYPLRFQVAPLVVVTKMDTLPAFDFSFDRFNLNVRKRNPNAVIYAVSAKLDKGIDTLADYLYKNIEKTIRK